ncbi:MAG TPA: neutral zinc metallopeptidase [Albitalea sp.]
MRWEGNRESQNVEDARGMGRGGGFRIGGGSLSLGSIVIAVIAGWIFGINPLEILGLMSSGGGAPQTQQAPAPPADDPMARFVSVVLADTEDVWRTKFREAGQTYREPKLRLFRDTTPTACGQGQAAMGPFYCPADERVYIDLRFYEVMRARLGAPGDFAQAYVIAHEVAHHVQKLLGVHDRVAGMRGQLTDAQNNALSVRVELQADCFAGIWAHDAQAARQVLEQGDIEEALNAASQIGDDNVQRRSRGTVVPESFTHGTSAQRVAWFKRGLQSGQLSQCDTFAAREL